MKGTHQSSSSSSEVCNPSNEAKTSANDSDDERWEDKLVIDLDANTMDTKQAKGASTAEDSIESDGSNPSTKDQPIATNSKNGRNENSTLGKPKGKRGGQKKATETAKNENSSKQTGKMTKSEKEKVTGNKPGRKTKEKQSPTPKFEINSSELNPDDPYKFDQNDEKISGTMRGKTNGKAKNKGEQKCCKDAQTEYHWRSVASVTEPENLGPCEPGTQVCLEGIVWQETNNGVLVVNVTWKGKTYMGTLLDATKHDWSPPSCDLPTGDFEGRTPKGRGKRSRVPLSDTFKDINERKLRKEMRKQSSQNQSRPKSPASPPKSENGKRKGRSSECDTSEPVSKRGRSVANATPPSPPTLIECPEPNCGKKYKQMNGLKYHQRNAHPPTSPQVVSSDTTSDGADKVESASSPEEPTKTKSSNSGSKKPADSARGTTKDSPSPGVTIENSVKNNTTSVITPTTSSLTTPSTSQSSNVPVAAVTPQVAISANSSSDSIEQTISNGNIPSSSAASRPLAISAPPKLISKPSVTNSAMAPISTITSPSVYNNSTLKPIQPKPTILGEVTPNPALHDLMDQKKLKRKRSASKEDLVGLNAYGNVDSQKLTSGGVHKFDTEHRGLLSTGGMVHSADSSNILQSPSYSDISEDSEIKNSMTRRELLSASRTHLADGSVYPQPPYLVATVSPQKNAPVAEKEGKKSLNRQTPSHSPAPGKTLEEKQHHKQFQHNFAQASWAAAAAAELYQSQVMLHHSSNKDPSRRSVSPKPNPFKNSTQLVPGRDMDNRASSDRLQLLKESRDIKASSMTNRHGQDMPRDYTMSSNTPSQQSNDFMYREMEQDHHKHELMKNISPASKVPSSSIGNKMPDNTRYERMPMTRSSPMPPPGSFLSQFNTLLPFGIPANQMLARAPFLPGFNYPHLETLSADNKDNRNSASPSFSGKSGHKIHELEGMQSSKSPRPGSSNDRLMSAKNHPITSQSQAAALHSAAAMLGTYGSVLHPGMAGMAGLFQPPK